MLTLDVHLTNKPDYGFCKQLLCEQFRNLLTRADVQHGDFVIRVNRRTSMRRENPVLRIASFSSVDRLHFALWLTAKSGNKHFMECELYSATHRKHGVAEKMRALAVELNSETKQALPLLRKRLEADSAMLKRIIVRMRETKKKIREMEVA